MKFAPLYAVGLALCAGWAGAQDEPAVETFPQIVRVSYVQGDVRVARGKEGQKASGAAWQKAEANLPLEGGFSLVTGGDGRAEIEFEDASTIYLAENSVLEFDDLSATNGVPHTDVTLLSGTMSLDLRMMTRGDLLAVHTPTDSFVARWPDKARLRVNSFLDAMTLTSPENVIMHTNWVVPTPMKGGVAATFREGQRIFPEKPLDQTAYAGWDAWVAAREAARDEAMAAAMKDAGLKEPLPGLPELAGAGHFFDCAPYGTCWEPTVGWGATQQPAEVTRQTVSVSALQQGGTVAPRAGVTTRPAQVVDEFDFPCTPWQVLTFRDRDPLTGKLRVVSSQVYPAGYWGLYPYRWTACHAGSWIRREHRYVWVVGRRRHHHCPVHWVKAGRTAGFVPVHPRDVAGKPPVNLKEGIYHATDRKGTGVERLAYSEGAPVKLLDEAPKQFRAEYVAPLGRVEAPRVETRALTETYAKEMAAITFDHKTQGFVVARQVQASNGATRVVSQPLAGRGESYAAARGGSAAYSGGGGATASRGSSYSGGGGASYNSAAGAAASHASAPAASAASSSAAAASSSGKR